MNYIEAMNYLNKAEVFGIKLGLERTERILQLLDNPHKKIKTIHIAGTNGKGSTTAMVSNILIEAGYNVGMYTSPYIEEFEERIQVNHKFIPKESLARIITDISKVSEIVKEEGYGNPTYFEIVTCAAFLYFYRETVDFAVMEVGMGGRLDSTNVINPLVSAITSISYDHMQILGDTLDKIAMEKAGIIKYKTPVVLYPQEKSAQEVIEKICEEKDAPLTMVKQDDVKFLKILKENEKIRQLIEVNTVSNSYTISLNLLGTHQLLNCSLSINIIEKLQELGYEITREHIEEGLKKVKWNGRLEIMDTNPMVVVDGAHNIDGIRRLKESVQKYFHYKDIVLILGIVKDKEVYKMAEMITPMAKKVIAVTAHSDRATSADELRDVILNYNENCLAMDDYEEAYNEAVKSANKDDLILISGSLYMISDMRKVIKKSYNNI